MASKKVEKKNDKIPKKTTDDTMEKKTSSKHSDVKQIEKNSSKSQTKHSDKKSSDKHKDSKKSSEDEKSKKSSDKHKDSKKSSDDEKPKKISRYANTEKGDKDNKETAYAGLSFNVKETKRWLAKYYKLNFNKDYVDWLKSKRIEKKLEENKDAEIDEDRISRTNIKNAHFALGFIEEILCVKLIDAASVKAKKSKVKTYVITEDDILNTIKLDQDLNFTFGKHMNLYNRDEDYETTMKLSRKIVYKFIDEKTTASSSVQLDDHALNILLFVLHQNRVCMASSAYNKMMYAKKSSVDYRGILYSVFDHYSGKLRDQIFKKVDSKIKLFSNIVSSDDDEEDDDTPKDKKKHSSDDKDSKKNKKHQSDDESDNSDDDNSDSD